MAPQPRNTAEHQVLNSAADGTWAQCANDVVRAQFIQDVLLDGLAARTLHTSGLRLEAATIEGVLNLEGWSLERLLVFRKCIFGGPTDRSPSIHLADAELSGLGLNRCTIYGGIHAPRLQIRRDLHIHSSDVYGTIFIPGCNIQGRLIANCSTFSNAEGRSISADDAMIGGELLLEGIVSDGTISFQNAEIGGHLNARPAEECLENGMPRASRLTAPVLAMDLSGASLGGDLILTRISITGQVILKSAKIKGRISSEIASFGSATSDVSILADHIDVAGDWLMSGSAIGGGIRIPRANIRGRFAATAVRDHLTNQLVSATFGGQDVAFEAEGASFGADVSISHSSFANRIVLRSVSILGFLWMNRVRITVPPRRTSEREERLSIDAEDMKVQRSIIARGLRVEIGSLKYDGANIGSNFILSGSHLKAEFVAVQARRASISGDFSIANAQVRGRILLSGTSIGGRMVAPGARVRGRDRPRLAAVRARSERS